MKKNAAKRAEVSENFKKANKIIESEKTVLSDGCKSLMLQDFAATFARYFELSSAPQMTFSPDGKGYSVSVSFSAALVKKFNVLK